MQEADYVFGAGHHAATWTSPQKIPSTEDSVHDGWMGGRMDYPSIHHGWMDGCRGQGLLATRLNTFWPLQITADHQTGDDIVGIVQRWTASVLWDITSIPYLHVKM
eukprot:359328-Chlamydomonas_euryale.AAC.3